MTVHSSTQRQVFDTGQLFHDRYRIVSLIGCGGMGEVYLAEDTVLEGERVALKVLLPEHAADERSMKRFLREVQLARKVTHTNVARTFEVGVYEGRAFLTMEYVEGKALTDLLEVGALPYYETCQILHQIADGLGAIHQADIVHRDLKPANIMLTPNGTIKITDFGIARPGASSLTLSHEVVGSAPYMSPEVWTGKEVGPAADFYSLGILAYELLTGILPFQGETSAEMMFHHLESEVVLPSTINAAVPVWIDRLILQLLAKESSQRVSSADELLRLIDSGLSAKMSHEGYEASTEPCVLTGTLDLAPPSMDPPPNTGSIPIFLSGAAPAAPVEVRGLAAVRHLLYSEPTSLPAYLIQWGLRCGLAGLVVAVIFLAILKPAGAIIAVLWSVKSGFINSAWVWATVPGSIVYAMTILTLPLFFLAVTSVPLQRAVRVWSTACLYGSFITLVVLAGYTGVGWMAHDEPMLMLRPTVLLQSAQNAILCIARGLTLAPFGGSAEWNELARAAFPRIPKLYAVLLMGASQLCAYLAVAAIAAREILSFDTTMRERARVFLGATIAIILFCESVVLAQVTAGAAPITAYPLGAFELALSVPALVCAAINWGLLNGLAIIVGAQRTVNRGM